MTKTRRVFLFGAGAVLEWGAPTTSELTQIVLNSGFKMCDNTTTITGFIRQTLLSNGYQAQDINFETIISAIEELIVYYSSFNASKNTPSLHKCLFSSKFNDELLNFSIKGGKHKHGYVLEIPKGVKYDYGRRSYQNETPEQFYFEHLLSELLTDICVRVIEYSYHSTNHSVIDMESESSKSFVEWMKLHEKQTPLRLYTLNYDQIFKALLEKNNIRISQGFDIDEKETVYRGIRPNAKRILTDFEGHVYYNLHGSANWDVADLDIHQLANAEIFYTSFPNLQSNNTPASTQIEKGKTLMITNIITGYQKAQKAMITPFKQMQSAFDRDCCFADEIYIIGYSFGDEHINSSLRTALRHNSNLKIIIVDPFFIKNNLDEEVAIKLFSSSRKDQTFPEKLDSNLHSYNNGSFMVYTMGFEEFREKQLNTFNKAAGGILFP